MILTRPSPRYLYVLQATVAVVKGWKQSQGYVTLKVCANDIHVRCTGQLVVIAVTHALYSYTT